MAATIAPLRIPKVRLVREMTRAAKIVMFISENGIVAVLGDENQLVIGDLENQSPPPIREGAYGPNQGE